MFNIKKSAPIITAVIIMFCIIFFIIFLPSGGIDEPSYKTISGNEAKKIMNSGKPYVILDVRTETEFESQWIEGAILIPHDQIREQAEEKLPKKNKTILIYCRRGRRSAIAANELVKMGYKNVYDFGGLNTWTFETVGGSNQ